MLKGREQNILKLDGEGEQPVQKRRDRRKLILQPIGVNQLQSGGVFKGLERAAIDFASRNQMIELAQRITTILAFEVVVGPEQALPSGLALTAGDGAQCVQPPSDREEEALFRLHVSCDRPKQRWLRLIGPVGAAE